jgi:sugar phosphate isomerase/epimerase
MTIFTTLKKLALAGTAASTIFAASVVPSMAQESHLGLPVDQIGVVSFTLREMLGQDPRATLDGISQCGIKSVEFSSPNFDGPEPKFANVPVSEIAAFQKEFGFIVPSLGVNGNHITDSFDSLVEAAKTVGASYVRISGISGVEGETQADYYARLAAFLNEEGAKLKAAGLTLAYHNHDAEFEDLGDGTTGYQVLLDQVQAENASFELDLYWAAIVTDPVQLINDNPGRFPLYHVKDRTPLPEGSEDPYVMTTVGNGDIDWATIFALDDVSGVEHYFIENDRPFPNGVVSACDGYAYLTAATLEDAQAGAAAAQPAIDEATAAAATK